VVIIYDDLALEPGRIRLRMGGSSGSHNGMQHVIDTLQTQDIKRIRVGIGAVPVEQKGKDYVLGIPSANDQTFIQSAIADVVKAIEVYLASDFSQAMNRFNRGGSD
jgi:PTH1 family peptidyl-tRNA hydrolase